MARVVDSSTTYVRRSATANGRTFTFVVMDTLETGGYVAVASSMSGLGRSLTAYDWTPEAATRKLIERARQTN